MRRKLHGSSSINHKLFVDRDALRESVQTLVQSVLEDEVERFIGAGRYERREGRRSDERGNFGASSPWLRMASELLASQHQLR